MQNVVINTREKFHYDRSRNDPWGIKNMITTRRRTRRTAFVALGDPFPGLITGPVTVAHAMQYVLEPTTSASKNGVSVPTLARHQTVTPTAAARSWSLMRHVATS